MATAEDLIDERYLVRELLGRGGMAEVYRATDTDTRREVAIKLLRDPEPGHTQRFSNELDVHARLDHPRLVKLRGSGTHEGVPYLVLDLVHGPTLADQLADGPLGLERTLVAGHQVADALAHVHGMRVVHRDVKPSNIIFDARGAHLADFGIARAAGTPSLTRTGQVVGSAPYLAPEHVEGKETGPPADVYALGLVLVECLTGRRCYTGGQVEAALSRLHRAPELPDDLPEWLRDVLTAMTARHPARRPTAAAVAESLRRRTADPVLAATTPHDILARQTPATVRSPNEDVAVTASIPDPLVTAPVDVRTPTGDGGAPHDPTAVGPVPVRALDATPHRVRRGGPARTRRTRRAQPRRLATVAAAAVVVTMASLLAWAAGGPDSPQSRSSAGSAQRPIAAVAGPASDTTAPGPGPAPPPPAPPEQEPADEARGVPPGQGAAGSGASAAATGNGSSGPNANASPNAGGDGRGNGGGSGGGSGKG